MHLHWFFFLLIFLFGANADLTSDRTNENAATFRRFLRDYDGITDSNQERDGLSKKLVELAAKLSPNQKLTNKLWLKTGKVPEDAYKFWLKAKTTPEEAFKILRLGEAGKKLNDNPRFIQWLKYVDMYRTQRGEDWFSDTSLHKLLRTTLSKEEVVKLYQSMRQVRGMKSFADRMQKFMSSFSPPSRTIMNEEWLKSGEKPKEVFNIKEEAVENNPSLIQWLRYTEMYQAEMGEISFSKLETLRVLLTAKRFTDETNFGLVFQSLKKFPDLKNLAENLQTSLFHKWITVKTLGPNDLLNRLATPNMLNADILKLPTSDPKFSTLEAYTLQFAFEKGGKATMDRVKTLFANDHPEAALAAAVAV